MVLTRGCDAVGQSCTPSHLRPHAPSLCPHLAPGFPQAPLVLRPALRYGASAQNSMATTYMRAAQQNNHEQVGAPSLTWGWRFLSLAQLSAMQCCSQYRAWHPTLGQNSTKSMQIMDINTPGVQVQPPWRGSRPVCAAPSR